MTCIKLVVEAFLESCRTCVSGMLLWSSTSVKKYTVPIVSALGYIELCGKMLRHASTISSKYRDLATKKKTLFSLFYGRDQPKFFILGDFFSLLKVCKISRCWSKSKSMKTYLNFCVNNWKSLFQNFSQKKNQIFGKF